MREPAAGSEPAPPRGVSTAYQAWRPGGAELEALLAYLGAGRRCVTVVAPHLSRPGVKGDPLLQSHKRPTSMSVKHTNSLKHTDKLLSHR